MRVFTFTNEDGNDLTLMAHTFEQAMFQLCKETEHPTDWMLKPEPNQTYEYSYGDCNRDEILPRN